MELPSREEWVAAGVFGLLLLAVGGLWFACTANRRAVRARFAPRMADYFANTKDYFKAPADLVDDIQSPYRKGKMVVLNADKREVDPLHFKLPDPMRADTPDEVGTVVFVQSKAHKSGSYGPLANAYYVDWSIYVVDPSRRKVVALFGYGMSAPSRVRFPFWDRYGSKPKRGILDDLEKLPAK